MNAVRGSQVLLMLPFTLQASLASCIAALLLGLLPHTPWPECHTTVELCRVPHSQGPYAGYGQWVPITSRRCSTSVGPSSASMQYLSSMPVPPRNTG